MANHTLGKEQGENAERFGEGFPMKQDMRGHQELVHKCRLHTS